jgi:glycosyltransferase involved in cell wall biosynthesis
MPPVTATLITFNEAESIVRALRSVSFADEILVVDSGSTDATAEIASRSGAKVITHAWEGFAAQKNFANQQACHDWILSLDADEELNPEAQAAIQHWKVSEPAAAGYRWARRAHYLGRWILHSGWYPDYKIRLFDRRRSRWEGAYVHESVKVQGLVETLAGEILHYTCDSLEDHRKRIEYYTELAAREMLDRGEQVGPLTRTFLPPWVFVNSYFVHLGVLDGIQGFWIARMAARYVRRKYSKWAQFRVEAGKP